MGTIRPCLLNFHIYHRLLNFAMLSLHSAQPIFSDWARLYSRPHLMGAIPSLAWEKQLTFLGPLSEQWASAAHHFTCASVTCITVASVNPWQSLMSWRPSIIWATGQTYITAEFRRREIALGSLTKLMFWLNLLHMMSFNHLQETGQFYDIEEVYVLFTYLGKPSSVSCISQLPLSIWSPKI